jgi:hypothetical protein
MLRHRRFAQKQLATFPRQIRIVAGAGLVTARQQPHAAASSLASGMFREPLNGEACNLPIRRDQPHPMTGYRTVIESFIALSEVDEAKLGKDRAYVLPAHRVTPQIAEKVITEVAAERGIKLGPIIDAFDARIQGIVDNWPQQVDGSRAVEIGLSRPPELKVIVEQFVENFLCRM